MGELYKIFKEKEKQLKRSEFFKNVGLVKLEKDQKSYEVFYTKRKANRRITIRCEANTVYWDEIPIRFVGVGMRRGVKEPLITLSPAKDKIRIFVVKGEPNAITGLDDGIFGSFRRYDEKLINVMSEARFKEL